MSKLLLSFYVISCLCLCKKSFPGYLFYLRQHTYPNVFSFSHKNAFKVLNLISYYCRLYDINNTTNVLDNSVFTHQIGCTADQSSTYVILSIYNGPVYITCVQLGMWELGIFRNVIQVTTETHLVPEMYNLLISLYQCRLLAGAKPVQAPGCVCCCLMSCLSTCSQIKCFMGELWLHRDFEIINSDNISRM